MQKLQDLYYRLDGYKTYIIAIVAAVVNLLVALGWLTTEHLDTINVILVALGGAAIRAGIKKV